jgi:hypothetical protein
MSAIGAEPDMRHYLALVDGGAIEPFRKSSGLANSRNTTD